MLYSSTKGLTKNNNLYQIILRGLAEDGGLYLPNAIPQLTKENLSELANKSLAEVIAYIFNLYDQKSFNLAEYQEMSSKAMANFTHPAKAPIVELSQNVYFLDLTLGRSLSFKDYAMSMLSQILEKIALKEKKSFSVLVATSGDTGSAAILALKDIKNSKVFVLFPKAGVSNFQRLQMTTSDSKNVFPLAVDGSFDDCQGIVKTIFSDTEFSEKQNLIAVNSINWARILSQLSYYVYTCLKFQGRKINYVVPSGNFGNIFAGYLAKQMGLNINKLIIACNENDVMNRLYTDKSLKPKQVVPSLAPSMDIQVPSNFERYLYYLFGCDSSRLAEFFAADSSSSLSLTKEEHEKFCLDFQTAKVTDSEIISTIRKTYETSNIIIDPHTACGVFAYNRLKDKLIDNPTILVATAHPTKFEDTIYKAISKEIDFPSFYSFDIKKEDFLEIDASADIVRNLILQN